MISTNASKKIWFFKVDSCPNLNAAKEEKHSQSMKYVRGISYRNFYFQFIQRKSNMIPKKNAKLLFFISDSNYEKI